jgi:hypothetical protein
MTKRFYKHKILLDENVQYRAYFPTLNSLFDVKHLTEDYNKAGLPDPQVYKLAVKEGRILVTFNIKDFEAFAVSSNKIGVVGISSNLPVDIIDKKLTSFFRKASQKSLLGKLTVHTGETEI